jgi:hypothetical protein
MLSHPYQLPEIGKGPFRENAGKILSVPDELGDYSGILRVGFAGTIVLDLFGSLRMEGIHLDDPYPL